MAVREIQPRAHPSLIEEKAAVRVQLALCKIALPPRKREREVEERGGPVVARVPSLLMGRAIFT